MSISPPVHSGDEKGDVGTARQGSLVEILADALRFYEREWQGNAEGDIIEAHLTHTWMEPTEALWDDAGAKARDALTELALQSQATAKQER